MAMHVILSCRCKLYGIGRVHTSTKLKWNQYSIINRQHCAVKGFRKTALSLFTSIDCWTIYKYKRYPEYVPDTIYIFPKFHKILQKVLSYSANTQTDKLNNGQNITSNNVWLYQY